LENIQQSYFQYSYNILSNACSNPKLIIGGHISKSKIASNWTLKKDGYLFANSTVHIGAENAVKLWSEPGR